MAFERLIPGTKEWDAYYANHIVRYQYAFKELSKSNRRNVLDAATGVGYGANYLAKCGIEKVVAIDRNDHALKIASTSFFHNALSFYKDDCHVLLEAEKHGPFDAIVSFETLEHLPKPTDFLKRCYELLQPGGLLLISTPNATLTSPEGKVNWKYHEKEYTEEELCKLLLQHQFSNISVVGQSYSEMGQFRRQIREEMNKINSNPSMRLGRFLQKVLKNHTYGATLPEQPSDFEIIDLDRSAAQPPIVLIATAFKAK